MVPLPNLRVFATSREALLTLLISLSRPLRSRREDSIQRTRETQASRPHGEASRRFSSFQSLIRDERIHYPHLVETATVLKIFSVEDPGFDFGGAGDDEAVVETVVRKGLNT